MRMPGNHRPATTCAYRTTVLLTESCAAQSDSVSICLQYWGRIAMAAEGPVTRGWRLAIRSRFASWTRLFPRPANVDHTILPPNQSVPRVRHRNAKYNMAPIMILLYDVPVLEYRYEIRSIIRISESSSHNLTDCGQF